MVFRSILIKTTRFNLGNPAHVCRLNCQNHSWIKPTNIALMGNSIHANITLELCIKHVTSPWFIDAACISDFKRVTKYSYPFKINDLFVTFRSLVVRYGHVWRLLTGANRYWRKPESWDQTRRLCSTPPPTPCWEMTSVYPPCLLMLMVRTYLINTFRIWHRKCRPACTCGTQGEKKTTLTTVLSQYETKYMCNYILFLEQTIIDFVSECMYMSIYIGNVSVWNLDMCMTMCTFYTHTCTHVVQLRECITLL